MFKSLGMIKWNNGLINFKASVTSINLDCSFTKFVQKNNKLGDLTAICSSSFFFYLTLLANIVLLNFIYQEIKTLNLR